MDDKSVPYNLRLRKDHKASAATEGSKGQKQAEREFQEKGGEEVLSLYGCDKCGCSFDLQPSLRSHHCKVIIILFLFSFIHLFILLKQFICAEQ